MSTTSGPALCARKRNKATETAGTAGKSREPQDWAPGGKRRSEHMRVLPALDVAGGARMEGLQGRDWGAGLGADLFSVRQVRGQSGNCCVSLSSAPPTSIRGPSLHPLLE